MTNNDLQWLSHFLRRVVTHNPAEIEQLWRLVTKIESQLHAQSQCAATRPTGVHDVAGSRR
jgi:hypothetical protein